MIMDCGHNININNGAKYTQLCAVIAVTTRTFLAGLGASEGDGSVEIKEKNGRSDKLRD